MGELLYNLDPFKFFPLDNPAYANFLFTNFTMVTLFFPNLWQAEISKRFNSLPWTSTLASL